MFRTPIKISYFVLISFTMFVFGLSGCTNYPTKLEPTNAGTFSAKFDRELFDFNRSKWRSHNIGNYTIDLNASGLLRPFVPATSTVKKSKFISIAPKNKNDYRQGAIIYKELKISTLDELFDFIEKVSHTAYVRLDVIYDSDFGYPSSIIFDPYGGSDSAIFISVKDLRIH